jgi:hypothetical protein
MFIGCTMISGLKPMWQPILEHNMTLWDKTIIIVDGIIANIEHIKGMISDIDNGSIIDLSVSHEPYSATIPFRARFLPILDKYKPDVFALPDDDEAMPRNTRAESERLLSSGAKEMKFKMVELAIDGGPTYRTDDTVLEPHVKMIRWQPGIEFYPNYPGYGQTATYRGVPPIYSEHPIIHYAAWTEKIAKRHLYGNDAKQRFSERAKNANTN